MSTARPLRRCSALQAAASRDVPPPRAVHARAGGHGAAALGPLGGLSVDTSPCLRTGECLAKRPGLQARPWTARRAKGAR